MSELVTLSIDSPEIQYLCKKDKRLAKVISMVGPIEYTHRESKDGYAFLIHEIIEQMLSVKAGARIFGRLEDLCNKNITPETVCNLTIEEIRSTGTSSSKARCIKDFTAKVASGQLSLSSLNALPDKKVIEELTAVRGIGNWTAKMYLLFVLNRQDVLPYEDGAFLQSYRWVYKTSNCSPKDVIKRCAKWKPYSSIASRYFYRALDMGLTKAEFHLYK